ncbi:MAG: macro domain-containing protein [Pseudomonadota bacterium]
MSAFIRRHWQYFGKQMFLCMGVCLLIADLILISASARNVVTIFSLQAIAAIVLASAAFATFQLRSVLSGVRFTISGTRTELTIAFGDLLELDGSIFVPVNNYFDHLLEGTGRPTAPVARSSLHGKLIEEFGGSQPFADAVSSGLDALPQEAFLAQHPSRPIEPKREAAMGTTVSLPRTHVKEGQDGLFHLVSVAKTDNTTFRSLTMLSELVAGLSRGFEEISTRDPDRRLAVPLVGSGFGRVKLDDEHLLDVIVATLAEVHAREDVRPTKVTVVLHQRLRGRLKLYNLRREWGA